MCIYQCGWLQQRGADKDPRVENQKETACNWKLNDNRDILHIIIDYYAPSSIHNAYHRPVSDGQALGKLGARTLLNYL